MKRFNRTAAFILGVAFGVADMALVGRYHRAHQAPPPTDCITVEGLKDFCFSPGCTMRRRMDDMGAMPGSGGFDLSCHNGLTGHFALDEAHDL